jgi:DNA-binding response OmpR family regulator
MSELANILVVDDDDFVRASFANELTAAEYEVATAENGEAALALLAESDFDAALVDIRMPGIDGLTVVKEGLEIAPETRMIVITGYASIDTAVEALRYGAYDYLRKPCRSRELIATVARAVENRRLQQEVQLLRKDMIDMLVHDLKGPLSIISGAYSMLEGELSALEEGKVVRQWLEIAQRGQVRLDRLINTLLEMSRLEAGEPLGERKAVTPLTLVRETISQLKPLADIRDLKLRTKVASRLPKVQVDRMLMVRVLSNLLDNAIKGQASPWNTGSGSSKNSPTCRVANGAVWAWGCPTAAWSWKHMEDVSGWIVQRREEASSLSRCRWRRRRVMLLAITPAGRPSTQPALLQRRPGS